MEAIILVQNPRPVIRNEGDMADLGMAAGLILLFIVLALIIGEKFK